MSAKYEAYIESEADGLDISVLAVVPDETPYRGILQLVHGMSEYKERYLPFMEYMAKRGYVCVIHDHRGHGKSVRAMDDLGYMYGGGADAILKDIEVVNREMHQQLPDLPLILFGHSMGSLAVRAFARDHDDCMDMLIICGSPSKNTARPLGVALAHAESTVFGPTHRSHVIEALSFGGNVMRFRKDQNCTSWICANKAAAQEYSDSELCGFTFTDDGYLALFELMKRALRCEALALHKAENACAFCKRRRRSLYDQCAPFRKSSARYAPRRLSGRKRQALSGHAPRDPQ